jgi:hypothetical protein
MGRRGAFFGILATLLAARVLSIVLHHLLATPAGARAAEHPFTLVPATLAGEIGTIALLGLLAGLVSRFSERAGLLLLAMGGVFVLFLSQLDLELVRWTGEHLNFNWLFAYDLLAHRRLLRDVVFGDTLALSAAALLVAVPGAFLVTIARRRGPERVSGRSLAFLAVVAFAGLFSGPLLAPTAFAFRRARPVFVSFAAESMESFRGRPTPGEVGAGIEELHRFLNRPPGWFASEAYPVWHVVPSEEASYRRFRARPLAAKPDILLVVLESARGWETDFRRPAAEERVPSLHRIWKERGVSFPSCVATGYPSIEGRGAILLGVAGDPPGILLEKARHLRVLSIGEILARAGYRRELVAATSPAFERMEDWYPRWFDAVNYDPKDTTDEDLASRVIERLAAPHDAPLFLTLFTIATHPPLYHPPGSPEPKDPRARYLAALAYTDRELGRVFDALRTTSRGPDTIVIVVGDHSTTNPWQAIRLPRLGTPNAGENWTTLLVAAPGVPAGTLRPELASQLDVAPTLLGLLSLDVSNHFFGRDLFAAPRPQGILALRFGGLAAFEGPWLYQARLDDPTFQKKWRWEVYEAEPDPPNGDYHHGSMETVAAADRARIGRLETMARAWGVVLDDNRVMPPPLPGR